MARHDDQSAVAAQVPEQRDDALGLDVVEVGGRLVGQEHRRVGGEAARHRDALLLAARELARLVVPAVVQPDALEQLIGPDERRPLRDAGQDQRHGHVLAGVERGHEVEGLEHEPDHPLAVVGQRRPGERGHRHPTEVDGAGRRAEDAAERREQRRLPAPRRPEEHHQLARAGRRGRTRRWAARGSRRCRTRSPGCSPGAAGRSRARSREGEGRVRAHGLAQARPLRRAARTITAMTGTWRKARAGTATSRGNTGTMRTCSPDAITAAVSAMRAACSAMDAPSLKVDAPTALSTATSRRRSRADR